jgi:hypothetical protein
LLDNNFNRLGIQLNPKIKFNKFILDPTAPPQNSTENVIGWNSNPQPPALPYPPAYAPPQYNGAQQQMPQQQYQPGVILTTQPGVNANAVQMAINANPKLSSGKLEFRQNENGS